MKSADIKYSANKIKWRQHEMILVTATAVITLAGYLWEMYHTSAEQYASPFTNNHGPFNLYKNVLLPDIGVGLSAEALLPNTMFIRIHRSYIVAKKQITKIDKNNIWISSIELPVGANYVNEIGKIIRSV